jgi:hypothetical protein
LKDPSDGERYEWQYHQLSYHSHDNGAWTVAEKEKVSGSQC